MLTEMGGKVYFFTGQGCRGVEIPHPIYDPFYPDNSTIRMIPMPVTEPDPKPDSKSKTEVLKPCAICGDLTTRIVQSGGKMIFWCERHAAEVSR